MSLRIESAALSGDVVRRTVLDNGLTVLTRELHSSPIVTAMIWYRVGSRNEELGQTGKSHFLEHMLFKGTDRFKKGAIDLLTLKNGGNNNAFTSHDFTAYYFNFASDRWEIALDIEADRMVNCVFAPEEFEAEKKVVIEELRMGLDSPWGLLLQELDAAAYKVHPYRNPVIGWLQDVERATSSEQQAYYRKYYHPGNATLVLTGDFESDRVLDKVSEKFASIPRSPDAPPVTTVEPVQRGEKRLQVQWRSKVPRIALAYHTPEIASTDSYALQVLNLLLTEGKTSRLYQRLVERDESVTFVSAEYAETKDPTLFHIRAEARGSHTAEEIEAGIYEEVERIISEGATTQELDRAKHLVHAHFILSRERAVDQAMLLGQVETLQGLSYIETYLDRINAVSSEDVAVACSKYLDPSNRTVGYLIPDGSVVDVDEGEYEDA
ncbi:MAG TPA: pitrilysin family protein [Terriglobia bacterium]|nr:pitrilysin family protein [Terriglobia bacterium]